MKTSIYYFDENKIPTYITRLVKHTPTGIVIHSATDTFYMYN